MCETYFKTETEDYSIGRLLSERKYGGRATSSYSATGELLQYIYSVLLAKNHQKIRSRCLVHEFFFTDIFNDINHGYRAAFLKKSFCGCFRFIWLWLVIAIACFLSFLILFQQQSWIILRLRTKILLRSFHTKRVIMEMAMMEIINNCIAVRLNNNYFSLNESSSLY